MRRFEKFIKGMKAAFSDRKRASLSLILTVIVFTAMNLFARPYFSHQMISSNFLLLPEAVKLVFLYNSSNVFQMASTVTYALLAGPALVLMYLQFQSFGTGFQDLISIAPGILASGCTGCGAGIIGLLGLTGALTALPFNGLLITPAATIMMIYFITKSGNPEVCNL